MADVRDIHQIEYRWHDRRDLSPVASTMSQESLRGWDSLIRAWVRHPHVDGLDESVAYRVLPNGRAALAWRYEDWQAAERQDGTRGRPLVSRVLAGQANLLTPEVAIVLCRMGASATIGPVTTETELSVIKADELTSLVSEQAAALDQEAAWQDGLLQVVVAALSSPHTPLAIHVRDTYILKSPEAGLQCPLLWGLRRIVWPVLATNGRGWSFSTFEPPLGDVDPTTLPDILFRQAQDAPASAPARPRDEIKIRPFDPRVLDAAGGYTELAEFLLTEYQEHGGDELERLITGWCGAEQSLKPRLYRVIDELKARHPSTVMPEPPAPQAPAEPAPQAPAEPAPAEPGEPARAEGGPPEGGLPESEAAASQPAPAAPAAEDEAVAAPQAPAPAAGDEAVAAPQAPAPAAEHEDDAEDETAVAPQAPAPDEAFDESMTAQPPEPGSPAWLDWFGGQDRQPEFAGPTDTGSHPGISVRSAQPDVSSRAPGHEGANSGYSSRTWSQQRDSSLGDYPRAGKAPQLSQGRQTNRPQPSQTSARPVTISDLLKRLPAAEDHQEFNSIMGNILNPGIQPDANERVKARREVSKDDWYNQICQQFGHVLYTNGLSRIFQIIVIPDLDNQEVAKKIAEWTGHAHPAVIGGLLAAAKDSGDAAWQLMMQILLPKLAYRWTVDYHMPELWDPAWTPNLGGDSGRRGFNFFKKN